METDIIDAEAGLARGKELSDDNPAKAEIIAHWRGELGRLRVQTHSDRMANQKAKRFYAKKAKTA